MAYFKPININEINSVMIYYARENTHLHKYMSNADFYQYTW